MDVLNYRKINWTKKAIWILLLFVMMFLLFPSTVMAEGNDLLQKPDSIKVYLNDTELSAESAASNPQLSLDDTLTVRYSFDKITHGSIDTNVKYPLPAMPNALKMATGHAEYTITYGNPAQTLGTLYYDSTTKALSFQFADAYEEADLEDMYIYFSAKLDSTTVEGNGETEDITFTPVGGTAVTYPVTVGAAPDSIPKLTKKGPAVTNDPDVGIDKETNTLTWKIVVDPGAKPLDSFVVKDTFSANQEYVAGSMTVNGSAVGDELTLDEANSSFSLSLSGMTANQKINIIYKTKILSSAFLDESGTPKESGTIDCTNNAQAYYPGTDNKLGDGTNASYSMPITWIAKTSGTLIDLATGEMEWTVTIYNNGLSMYDVDLYDRISTGMKIKDSKATITTSNGTAKTVTDFQRLSDTDITDATTQRKYNIKYSLKNIVDPVNSVTTIKYRTIIANPDNYSYEDYPFSGSDSIYSNTAWTSYKLKLAGGGFSAPIPTPVVVKNYGSAGSALAKNGTAEPATRTVSWTIDAGIDGLTIPNAVIKDNIPTSGTGQSPHEYVDTDYCRPTYTVGGVTKNFTAYNSQSPNAPFTYELITINDKINNIVFRLGSITGKVTIGYRTTVTDPDICAANKKVNFYNDCTLYSGTMKFSTVEAKVLYNSEVIAKNGAVDYYNRWDLYNEADNTFPWAITINYNRMAMSDICITDTLPEGTSLVDGAVYWGDRGSGATAFQNAHITTPLSKKQAIPTRCHTIHIMRRQER